MSLLGIKFAIFLIFIYQIDTSLANETRDSKVLPVFQVVRFPNDICVISGGTKNGTCYTAEECSSKGGVNGGSCASGFGVCCTFTIGCGATSSENCTYFENTAVADGGCVGIICKASTDICQIRLDFNEFVVTGPSTSTQSIGLQLNGAVVHAGGKAFSTAGTCRTDTFSVGGAPSVPVLCGTLTGDHVYFDASDDCHDLNVSVGQSGIGTTEVATRKFNIKVTQISCTSETLVPSGCLQYHTGVTGIAKSFNFDQGYHLANQKQTICFRREAGSCRICYSAASITDVQLGTHTIAHVKHSTCCGYGTKGTGTLGYDCLLIPGASKAADSAALNKAGWCQAGGDEGLVTLAAGKPSATVCSKLEPFRLEFISDGFEGAAAAIKEGLTKGFKVSFFQKTC